MHLTPQFKLRTTALTLAFALFGLASPAQAQQRPAPQVHAQAARPQVQVRTPAQLKEALTTTSQRLNMPHYVSPAGRVVFNAHDPSHLVAIDQLSQPGNGVLEVMLVQGVQHTLGHFEGKYIHFQYANGTNNWRMRPWADRLRPSRSRMFGAMIQLSPEEATNLRTRIEGIFAEQGPEHLAGPRWENGHITNSAGVRGFNCASVWCNMPIGERGESIATVIGIPSNGDPFSLQRTFETRGNEKIVGIGLYGPMEPNLGANPNQVFAR